MSGAGQDSVEIADSAVHLAEQLHVSVFPLRPASKKPALTGWQQKASGDPESIRRLFRGRPAAGVGVLTGSYPDGRQLVVLDCDSDDAWAELEAAASNPSELRTVTVRTSRGRHLYFWLAAGESRVRVKAFSVNGAPIGRLDVKAHGGFVVAPPSRHRDGSSYEFVPGLGPSDVGIAEAPPWIAEGLRSPSLDSAEQFAPTQSTDFLLHPLDVELVEDFVRETSPAGVHRDVWIHALIAIKQVFGSDPRGLELAKEWSRKDPGRFVPAEWPSKFEEFEQRDPGDGLGPGTLVHLARAELEVPEFRTGCSWAEAQAKQAREKFDSPIREGFEIGQDLDWSQEPPPQRFLLEHRETGRGFMPCGEAVCLAAPGGTGKTFAVLQLAACVATGRPWLEAFQIGETVSPNVLVVLGESDMEGAWRRMHRIARALELSEAEIEEARERIRLIPLHGLGDPALLEQHGDEIRPSNNMSVLKSLVVDDAPEGGWGLIIIDPQSRLAGADVEADNRLATQWVQAMESLTRVPGDPTILVTAHSSKWSERMGRPDVRGVTGLAAAFRQVLVLDPGEPGSIALRTQKVNDAPESGAIQLQRGEGGVLVPEDEEARRRREDAGNDRATKKEATRERREQEQIVSIAWEILEAVQKAHKDEQEITKKDAVVPLVGRNAARTRSALSLLETKKTLAWRRHPDDGRCKLLELTDEGRTWLEAGRDEVAVRLRPGTVSDDDPDPESV